MHPELSPDDSPSPTDPVPADPVPADPVPADPAPAASGPPAATGEAANTGADTSAPAVPHADDPTTADRDADEPAGSAAGDADEPVAAVARDADEPAETGASPGDGSAGTGASPGDGGAPSPPPPPPGFADPAAGGGGGWAPPFQLLRSRSDRKLGGVAGGLAVAAGLDATLVRLAVVLGFLTGWGLLAYLIAWAVIPEEDPALGRHLVPAPEPTSRYLRVALTVLGVLGLLQVLGTVLGIVSTAIIGIGLFPFHVLGFGNPHGLGFGAGFLGLVLLVGGLLVLFRRRLPWAPETDPGPGSGTPGPGGGTGPTAGATPWAASSSGPAPGWAPTASDPGPTGTAGGAAYAPPGAQPGPGGAPGFSARASAAARAAVTNGPLLLVRAAGWLVGLWFLAAMLVGVAFWMTGALRVFLPALPIVAGVAALGVLGVTLIRSRRIGAVIAAMALLLVPGTLAIALTRVNGQAGERSVAPFTATDLEPEYRHSVGSLTLDLSALELPAGSRTPIEVTMGMGRVEVVVPWNTDVEARASVGFGTFDLFGNRQSGVNLDGRTRSSGQPGAAVIDLRIETGGGEVTVRRSAETTAEEALWSGEPISLSCEPSHQPPFGPEPARTLHCAVADGPADTPPLSCVVSAFGEALCRPVGEPDPPTSFSGDPGTLRCLVPPGGGESTCAPLTPDTPDSTTTTAPAPSVPSAPPGEYRCTIPEGGGPATCVPA